VGLAIRSTERIQRLTNSLLDINRLEAGQSIGNRQSISPLSLVDDSVNEVIISAKNKDLVLEVDVPSNLPRIFVDGDMIRRVLINLLENAIRFTPLKGNIQIGVKREERNVKVWVKDSGPGILPAFQEQIFEKFSRLSTLGGSRGLGLGLAFCRLAIEGHGGRIWVESKEGEGTSFIFLLPLVEKAG
jgi:NtrC-family two-component system sensor histidine kinase KinB